MDGIKKRSQQTIYVLRFREENTMATLTLSRRNFEKSFEGYNFIFETRFLYSIFLWSTPQHFKNTYYLYFLYGTLARYKILKSDGKLY